MELPPLFKPDAIQKRAAAEAAFTLLEILLVIGVIALLAVLMTPLLSSAVEKRNATVCIANLRQWGTAAALYAGEHNGAFPPGDPQANGSNNNGWFAMLALSQYLGVKLTTATVGTPAGFPGCPSKPRNPGTPYWYQANYAWNSYLLSPPVSSSSYGLYSRYSALDRPKIMMTDAIFKHTLSYWDYVASPDAPQPGWPNAISYRHQKATHILWSDGRVESTTVNTVGKTAWFR